MKKNVVGLILTAIAAVVYFASKASFAFPGISARLQAVWRGLDPSATAAYPLTGFFAKLLGAGNLIAPVCGAIAVALVYFLVARFVRGQVRGEATQDFADSTSMVAGGVAAVVFMFTPAVREGASHLDPRLVDAVWAFAIFALFIPYAGENLVVRFAVPALVGAMTGFGACDSALFVMLLPLEVVAIVLLDARRESRTYVSLLIFAVTLLMSFMVALSLFELDLGDTLTLISGELGAYFTSTGWLFILLFATVPFLTSIFSCHRAFNEKPDLFQWLFHLAMSFVAILAVATPLSPSALEEPIGGVPVVTSAFVAMTAGYLASYWWIYRHQVIAIVSFAVFAFVLAFSSIWNLFAFEADRGSFADDIARRVIRQLGDRKWLVTDGTLDAHLRLVAEAEGRELNIIALNRDLDEKYIAELTKVVSEKKIGGSKNEDLKLSLSLGVLPFVQDWFSSDPMIGKEVAIWGAPDIWYSAHCKPVPEMFFFGSDDKREPDWSEWKAVNAVLETEKGWGSYRRSKDATPVDRLKYSIRRHLGLVANNRGVYLLDEGKDDEAFRMFELVLGEIDSDNVCAIFNEIEMAGHKHAKALEKKRELERQIRLIIEDKQRRYIFWRLASYYGYIRRPDVFIRHGFNWARSGRPGDALAQIRRAIDFVPSDKRATFLNMMAALYASDNDQKKSRRIYEAILSKDASDHDALMGMMRLELMNGDSKKALKYLERAVATGAAKGTAGQIEKSMVAMMKNDIKGAKTLLQKAVDGEGKADLRAWSMLATITVQQYDQAKDDKDKSAIYKEVSEKILPEMEKLSSNPNDYYINLTKAFVLMRGGEEKRREARDAMEIAAKARPAAAPVQDLVLDLDISLDDRVNAERHAREVLRRNRNAPLANYVMGSVTLGRGDFAGAEGFLRKAVNCPKPTILALNDLAEVLRRLEKYDEAERYARDAIKRSPDFYILHETLGVILLGAKHDLDEAEAEIRKSIELSRKHLKKGEDFRLYTSLARVQVQRGDKKAARNSIRKVQAHIKELSDFEKRELEEVRSSVD